MIRLVSKALGDPTASPPDDSAQKFLDGLQAKVDAETSFSLKAAKAKSLWKSKEDSNAGQAAFGEIRETLKNICVPVQICNYCEQSEAQDIEHIEPKSFFPQKAFVWENYLLACKICNSGYKLDKCFVLDANGEKHPTDRGCEPLHPIHAFITPRTEDPNDFLLLNLQTFQFDYSPLLDLSDKAAKNKADCTLEILKLNQRDALIKARREAAIYFFQRMNCLRSIQLAADITEIENLLSPNDPEIEPNETLENLKHRLKASVKNDIQKHPHPSVWYAIVTVASKTEPRWKRVFAVLPEAEFW